MKDNYLIVMGFILDSWLHIYLIIMKYEASQLREAQKKKGKLKNDNEMTNQEFVELLDKIWSIDPDEEERLLEESFREGYQEFLDDEDDLEDDEDEEE